MANLPLLPQQQPALADTQHQDFRSFYGDTTLDPCQGDYAPIMARFDPEVNPGITAAMLLEQAAGSGPVPQAYLCCTLRQNQVTLVCVHLPSRYISSLDGRTTPWDGMYFAFDGEVIQGQVATVALPETLFRAVVNVPSHSTDYIVTNLDLIGGCGLPAPAPNAPDATAVTTRMAIYLPVKYVPLLLSPSGYTIRQVWEIIYPALVNANDLLNCAPLIKWLRAITTVPLFPMETMVIIWCRHQPLLI
jgi:hypothetical protein